MPTRPKSYAQLTYKRSRTLYDRRYDASRKDDPGLAVAVKIRNSVRWKALSRSYRREQPACQDPFGAHRKRGEVVSAAGVHHRVSIQDDPELAFERTNLMSLCAQCHVLLDKGVGGGLRL